MVENVEQDWSDEDNENMPQEHGLTLDMTPNVDVGAEGGDADICVKINVPEQAENAVRKAVDIVCCIDISGSM
jgi:hypothetical protein